MTTSSPSCDSQKVQAVRFLDTFNQLPEMKRRSLALKLKTKNPQCIPLIVDRTMSTQLVLEKNRRMVPRDITMGEVVARIRQSVKIAPEKALVWFVNNQVVRLSDTVGMIYDQHKREDQFLVILYSEETVFG